MLAHPTVGHVQTSWHLACRMVTLHDHNHMQQVQATVPMQCVVARLAWHGAQSHNRIFLGR
jgi:hypothetical protein